MKIWLVAVAKQKKIDLPSHVIGFAIEVLYTTPRSYYYIVLSFHESCTMIVIPTVSFNYHIRLSAATVAKTTITIAPISLRLAKLLLVTGVDASVDVDLSVEVDVNAGVERGVVAIILARDTAVAVAIVELVVVPVNICWADS